MPKPRQSPGPGRPPSMQKRRAILAAAKQLFLASGYAGTSMDQIAAEAGVSKLTVYNHFQDKQGLFFTAVEAYCRDHLPDELFLPPSGMPPEESLRLIGRRFHALLSSEDSLALHRMLLADPRNIEELGAVFWEAGAARIIAVLEKFLAAAVARGEFDIDDPREAAEQFLTLLKNDLSLRLVYGEVGAVQCKGPEAHVDAVVRLFLRAYLPR